MQRRYLWGFVAAFSVLGACQQTFSQQRLASRSVTIALTFEEPDTCRATFAGRSFSLAHEAAVLMALKQQAAVFGNATVAGGGTIPYKCFGHAIYLAQRAGFKRVGFIAQPPPPSMP